MPPIVCASEQIIAIINHLVSLLPDHPVDGLHLILSSSQTRSDTQWPIKPVSRCTPPLSLAHLNPLWPVGGRTDTPKKPQPRPHGCNMTREGQMVCAGWTPSGCWALLGKTNSSRNAMFSQYDLLCRLQCMLRVAGVACHAGLRFEAALEELTVSRRFKL
jgi:hypothetical protein